MAFFSGFFTERRARPREGGLTVWLAAYGLAAIAGVLLGLLSVWVALSGGGAVTVGEGPWHVSPDAGSTEAGLTTRARIALFGLFALNPSETVYYNAESDSEGRALSGACGYSVEGAPPDARWWSLTVYGADGYLLPDANGRFSLGATDTGRTPDGGIAIALRPTITRENVRDVLPTGTGAFNLLLRLYNPSPAIASDPTRARLPRIVRGACAS